jgi:hypothetical protein
MPALAGGVWLGLLAGPLVGDGLPVPVWLVLATVSFAAALALAPRRGAGADPFVSLAHPLARIRASRRRPGARGSAAGSSSRPRP